MQTINRTDKCSSITIFAFVLKLMVQILSVFSVKLTPALEIYRQKHMRTGQVGGGGGRGDTDVSMFILLLFWRDKYFLF